MRRMLSCVAVLVLTAAPSYGDEPKPTDAATLVELTKTALHHAARGDVERAHALYREMLSIDPDHALARRALGYVRVEAAWLTHPEARRTLLAAEAGPARRRRAPDVEPAALRRSLRLAPRAQDRADAAAALARFEDAKTLKQLRRSALTDPSPAVRHAAIDALARLDARRAVHHFGGMLHAPRRERRVRAAEALARVGSEVAAHYLVSRWERVSGKSPRAYFATLDQRSYIQDFDTEVAKTSFIADPLIGVAHGGAVANATILGTRATLTRIERAAYSAALAEISGLRPHDEVAAWRRWLTTWSARNRKLRAREPGPQRRTGP